MKHILLGMVLLAGTSVLASTIELAPGSVATITAGETAVVKCAGGGANLCEIKKSGSYWAIYKGGIEISPWSLYPEAINNLKNLNEAGMCN